MATFPHGRNWSASSSSLAKHGSPPDAINVGDAASADISYPPSTQNTSSIDIYALPPWKPSPSLSALRRTPLIISVLSLTSSALVPVLLGTFYYVSIGFKALNGTYLDGSFIRPVAEGFSIGWGHSLHFSPLLLSSLASSFVEVISVFVMCLFAYHLSHRWLEVSRRSPTSRILTPYQYFLTMNLISNASLFALLRFCRYSIHRLFQRIRSPNNGRIKLSPILAFALLGVGYISAFTWSIRIIDIVLHEKIRSTLILVNSTYEFNGHATIPTICLETVNYTCGVSHRTQVANLGGLNQSSEFRVYESSDRSRGSLAYIGPADPDPHVSLIAHTYAAATMCDIYHPSCSVVNQSIQGCSPTHDNPPYHYNSFNVAEWGWRLQQFLLAPGNFSEASVDRYIHNGANLNPLPMTSFGCFSDYSSIPYDDSNSKDSYTVPFINWWSYGQGIQNKPYILCSMSICNMTIYDAQYTLSNGSVSLDSGSLTIANDSAALVVSGAAVYLGTGDTSYYKYASRYLDDQMQLDLNAAGNTYGNDTAQFGAAWAQSYSNRLLGWSAGAVYLDTVNATWSDTQLAISIPVTLSLAFVALHYVYGAIIIVLGISCFFIPIRHASTSSNSAEGNAIPLTALSHVDGRTAADLVIAQSRLSDPSTVVHELFLQSERSRHPEGHDRDEGEALLLRNQSSTTLAQQLSDTETREMYSAVALRNRKDGTLGLEFVRA